MTVIRHGISIGIERVDDDIYMSLSAIGKLTHEDYELITPMIDSALEGIKVPSIKVFVDATRLEGWDLQAAWDDFKLGLKHGNKFDKVALLGNRKWQEWSTKLAGWFMSGETRYFESESEALEWLKS